MKAAFASIGYDFVWRCFDAVDLGAPVHRRRIYMAAYRSHSQSGNEAAAQQAAHAAVDRMAAAAAQHPLDDFLLNEAAVPSWQAEPARRRAKKTMHPPVHKKLWQEAPHAQDKAKYRKQLQGNCAFESMPARQRDLLLLRLCDFTYPGPGAGAIPLQGSAGFTRYSLILPTQLPASVVWLLSRSRLQLGVEAVALQGADLADLPACRPGGPFTDRQLWELAGNAFHVWQFVAWFLTSLAVIPL